MINGLKNLYISFANTTYSIKAIMEQNLDFNKNTQITGNNSKLPALKVRWRKSYEKQ